MNGRTWRISVIVAMMEYGEREVGCHDIIHIATKIFPDSKPWFEQADFELDQFRKHLRFLRDDHDAPSLKQQLDWCLSTKGGGTIRSDFKNFLRSHPCRSTSLREMADVRQSQPHAPKSRSPSGEEWRIQAK